VSHSAAVLRKEGRPSTRRSVAGLVDTVVLAIPPADRVGLVFEIGERRADKAGRESDFEERLVGMGADHALLLRLDLFLVRRQVAEVYRHGERSVLAQLVQLDCTP
jgi:hypothetical protein